MVIPTLQDRRVLSIRDDIGRNGLGDIESIERGSRETDRGGAAVPPGLPGTNPNPRRSARPRTGRSGRQHRQPRRPGPPGARGRFSDNQRNDASARPRVFAATPPPGRSLTASALLPPGLGGPALRQAPVTAMRRGLEERVPKPHVARALDSETISSPRGANSPRPSRPAMKPPLPLAQSLLCSHNS